ncbi:MAG TPA: family 1 glycosylhydrolase, partial [Steroidobacteraceae bacterium]|nr:family 1 glycosylhydrolase [Steroidobacteraceae bacterium]
MTNITRRELAQILASAAAAGAVGSVPQIATAAVTPTPKQRAFPSDLLWGCATASYQIEGAANEDGRAPSVWDTFSHTPGKVAGGDTGDVACDSYHRYKEDVQLLKNLGVKGYRMSISWSRVFPSGKGKPNPKGLDYYDRGIDELLTNGIQPYVTLFHWDLPQALPGGWRSRDTAKAYADYAAFMSKRLSDRVHHFFTINEFVCFTDLGYATGKFAPGLKLPQAEVAQIRHHGVLAHGLGVQAIRANARAGTQVGLAENAAVFVPVVETPEHIAAAQRAHRERNAPFLTAVLEGKYIDTYLNFLGADAPKVESGDMKAIGSPIDFVGLNVYTPQYVKADAAAGGYSVLPPPKSYPRMASDWLTIGPECLYWAVRNVVDIWKVPAIDITENGCSADDALTP